VIGERVRGERLAVDWIGDLPTVVASFGRSAVRLVLDSAATGLVLFNCPSAPRQRIGAGADARRQHQRAGPSADAHLGSLRVPHPRALSSCTARAETKRAGSPTSLFERLFGGHTVIVGQEQKVGSSKCKAKSSAVQSGKVVRGTAVVSFSTFRLPDFTFRL
jgi:hypothetical protein